MQTVFAVCIFCTIFAGRFMPGPNVRSRENIKEYGRIEFCGLR